MRVLQVIHQFPPHSSQGSEVHCHQLSKCLAATDEVRVFHVSNAARRRPRRLEREHFDGLETYHCIDGAEYARVADWPNEFLRQSFSQVLGEFCPDIVHFHNYLSLGDPLVTVARAATTRVVYTLHDFGLVCPNTLLRKTDGRLCEKNDPDFFQDCCPELLRVNDGRPPLVGRYLPSLARWRMFANQQSQPAVRAVLAGGVRLAEMTAGDPVVAGFDEKRRFFQSATRQIFRDADWFLAPSRFLMERYVNCGLPPGKIEFVRYGLRHFQPAPRRTNAERLTFGYIGALHAHKGVDVLLDAFKSLGGRANLLIFGSAFGSPISESYRKRIEEQRPEGVTFEGAYDNAGIAGILSRLDAVIVPSVWYENSPLTIQEAYIAGVPVVASGSGGMAELVRDGVDGVHFRLGDAADLRAKLAALIDSPGILETFRRHVPAVPEIVAQAAVVRDRYAALLAGPSSP